MVAEPQQMTSLRRPPDDWDQAAEDSSRRARQGGSISTLTWVGRQPRVDDPPAPTDGLPTLTIGISALPTSCPNCGSRFLNAEPPLGEHARGMISCGRCSRQVCWLRALTDDRPTRASFDSVMEAAQSPHSPARSLRLAPMRLSGLETGPGCGPACGDSSGHDAMTHELYGRKMARDAAQSQVHGRVVTGPLIVDFDRRIATMHGSDLALTDLEFRLLAFLASRAGKVCPHGEITAATWGEEDAEFERARIKGRWHILRIRVLRVRQRLGPAGHLIESIKGRGYRLRIEPPIESDGAP